MEVGKMVMMILMEMNSGLFHLKINNGNLKQSTPMIGTIGCRQLNNRFYQVYKIWKVKNQNIRTTVALIRLRFKLSERFLGTPIASIVIIQVNY